MATALSIAAFCVVAAAILRLSVLSRRSSSVLLFFGAAIFAVSLMALAIKHHNENVSFVAWGMLIVAYALLINMLTDLGLL